MQAISNQFIKEVNKTAWIIKQILNAKQCDYELQLKVENALKLIASFDI
jgi:hypothetical protein